MALKDTKFDAFISYRHAELDKFVAESIHKRLETFRLPSSVKRKNKLAKDRINRVFRDRDELPLASDLAEQITAALENSEFLIVICTPRLPESKWCRKEIETFIEMHGRQNVFAVLAEGEPSESFPDLLLYDEKEVVSETGVTEIVRVPVEPLAADVRGANKKEIRKKMDEELLRLVAPMFNLNYDDLKQRHREQKMKRIVSLSMIVSSIFIAFGIFSGILSLKISQQADEIYEQNTLIQNKNEEISKQAELLKDQNTELQKSYATSMALEGIELIEDGRFKDALYAVRNAMPDSLDDTSVPYSADAHRSLADILQIYKMPSDYFPKYNYDVDAPVTSFKLSEDNTKLMISDSSDTLTLWDVNNQTLLATFPLYQGNENICYYFVDNNTIVFSSPEQIIRYDISSGLTSELYNLGGEILLIPGSEDLFISTPLKVFRISPKGNIVWELNTLDFAFLTTEDLFVTEDASLIILPSLTKMIAINAENGDIVYSLPHTSYEEYVLQQSELYVMESRTTTSDTIIYRYDVTTGEKLWQETYEEFFYDFFWTDPDDADAMLISHAFDKVYAIDASNAKVISVAEFDQSVSAFSKAPKGGSPIITISSNKHYLFMPQDDEAIQISLADHYKPEAIITEEKWIAGAVFYSYFDKPMVSCYSGFNSGTNYTELNSPELHNYIINAAGTIRMEYTDTIAYFYDIKTNNLINTADCTDAKCHFVDDGSEYYILEFENSCSVYTIKDNKEVYTISSDEKLVVKNNYVLERVKTEDSYTCRIHSLKNFGNTYNLSDDVYFSFTDLFFADDSLPYALVESSNGLITIAHLQDPNIHIEIQSDISSISYCALSDDGKYLFVEHDDNRIEIYDMQDGSIKNIIYDVDIEIGRVEYISELNKYLVFSKYEFPNFVFTEELEICSEIPTCLAYNKQDQLMICSDRLSFYSIPIYTYEELIQMADELLGDYVPSQKIKRKHNI